MNTSPLRPINESASDCSLEEKIREFYHELLTNPFMKKPTNKEIARRMNTSESTFKMLFKKMYGCSPYQKHLDVKIEYAKQILQSGRYRVKEVAHLVGYCQSAKFVQIFREKVGKTPKKYGRSKKSL